MAQTYSLTGAHIRIYINNKVYNSAQSVQFTIDRGVTPQFGIDSPYAQELVPGKVQVSGSIQGIRMKNSGGLQANSILPAFTDVAASNYISIRIQDRQSGEDIFTGFQCMVTKESNSMQAKGLYRLSFDFVCIQPLSPSDRA